MSSGTLEGIFHRVPEIIKVSLLLCERSENRFLLAGAGALGRVAPC